MINQLSLLLTHVRYKSAALDDLQRRVTGIDGVEILRIATALDPRHKTLRCLSTEDKGDTWTAIAAKLSAAVDAEAHTE